MQLLRFLEEIFEFFLKIIAWNHFLSKMWIYSLNTVEEMVEEDDQPNMQLWNGGR